MNRGFNADEDFFEVLLLIAAAHGVSASSILNEFIREYVKMHYEVLFRFPGVKEAAQEFHPEHNFDRFVKRISRMKIRKRVRAKEFHNHKNYIDNVKVADVCPREDVSHENY